MSILYLITIKNIVEIMLITSAIYYFMRWIASETTKSLIYYLYIYSSIICAAYYFQLTILTDLLFLILPIFLTILVIAHSDQLQRHFVALKKIMPMQPLSNNQWVDELLRACLKLKTKNINAHVVVENADVLDPFISIACSLNTAINELLVEMLVPENTDTFMLITKSGTIRGVRCQWKMTNDDTWYTSKFDCLIVCSTSKGFTVSCQGKIIEQLSAPQVGTLIKHAILTQSEKGEYLHACFDTVHKKSTQQQSHS